MDRELRFIGKVRSEIKERKAMPALGARAAVELAPEFADGLLRIEKHTHFWVLAWLMARPERDVLQVTPRGVDPGQPDATHGVFSVRSPARPNPIGLSAARLLNRDGLRLEFDRLDFLDGTPVIDIKPYFVARDMIYSANSLAVGKPKDREALRESLVMQALQYVPERHADVALAVRMMEHYRVEVADWREPERWSVTLPLDRPQLADAIIGMTRVRLTKGLQFGPEISINGSEYRALPIRAGFEEILAADESRLFQQS